MEDRIRAGAWGLLAGYTLGSPFRAANRPTRIVGYDPIPSRHAPGPCLDAWVVLHRHALQARPVEGLSASLLAHWESWEGASLFGRMNLLSGLSAPASGHFANPLSDGGTGYVRALFSGLAFAGDPDAAFAFALCDVSSDHGGDGVLLPATWAAALAALIANPDLASLITQFAKRLPKSHPLLAALPALLSALPNQPRPELTLGSHDSAAQVAADALLALVRAGRDPSRSLIEAAQFSALPRQAAALAGATAAALAGALPEEWKQPLGSSYVSACTLRGLDPPAALDDWVQLPLSIHQSRSERPAPIFGVPFAPSGLENTCWARFGELHVAITYPKGFLSQSGLIQLTCTITNLGQQPLSAAANWLAPEGWSLQSRASHDRDLSPGENVTYVLIAQRTDPNASSGRLLVKLPVIQFGLPLLVPSQGLVIGPFQNHNGTGLSELFPPEAGYDPDLKAIGRAEIPVQWDPHDRAPSSLHLEPLFNSGPGTLYYTELLPPPKSNGTVHLLWAPTSPSALWWNGVEIARIETPTPSPQRVWSGTLSEAARILVKVTRGRTPIRSQVLLLVDDEGRPVS